MQTDVFGAHDFEGFNVLQNPVLMNTGFVQKGVFADDGLVELHGKA